MARGLRGNHDLWALVVTAVLTALLAHLLLSHLRVRQELYSSARDRSRAAFVQRQLLEEQRHLSLENRIRQAGISREERGADTLPAPPERTVILPLQQPHYEDTPSGGAP